MTTTVSWPPRTDSTTSPCPSRKPSKPKNFRARAVDEGGGQPPRPQRVHLILHQRDERRDDDRHAPAHQRRKLKAERLAAARRHDDDRVVAAEDGLDDLALPLAEALEAEELPSSSC